ncbi:MULTISPECIES: hypothetical protein [unclassified Undibacterium]|uniref:hypothetical protein n=1 Tax=unclassified Undibacterium TaxID=2630295 RepID=UPI002AC8D6B9|nr:MULTISPECIES: hypothetical protein [unclassified Undibacterium]MEB0138733.1 hypothetical protein [Undibacterium sp. CCC2.1]MEB0171534.1 hypothetical protein [Undibacterium sp. CCC1.1]MEB0175395.1 hypothetical protein [Undibacterium sp. CCC3.4]MEB0214734.1 hypothetical protein [Undibacterium sp. 5I2]WPX43308.1 hypothetical protein RHM61_18300 [Undibacterium sp. CCC3.4]
MILKISFKIKSLSEKQRTYSHLSLTLTAVISKTLGSFENKFKIFLLDYLTAAGGKTLIIFENIFQVCPFVQIHNSESCFFLQKRHTQAKKIPTSRDFCSNQ